MESHRVLRRTGGLRPLGELLEAFLDELESRQLHPGRVTGIPTGLADLDLLTDGLQKSDVIALAGKSGSGKTGLALGIARNAATSGNSVALISMDLSAEQVVQRLVSIGSGINLSRLRMGNLPDDERQLITNSTAELQQASIVIDDRHATQIDVLQAKIRRLHAERNLDLIVIDYLQLLRGHRFTSNREEETDEVLQGLKFIARELDLAIIVIVQLPASAAAAFQAFPNLSDLRRVGAIEAYADLVVFLHREELYDPETEKKGLAELYISKHRNGPLGLVILRFFEKTTRFADLELYREPDL